MKPGRNDPCPCGSGNKYKKCCQPTEAALPQLRAPSDKTLELNRLIELFNSGRFSELEYHAQALSRQYPSEGLIWKLLGFGLLMQGKEALPPLQKAARLLKSDAELHNYLGVALTSKEQYSDAEIAFRQALSITPHYPEALYNQNLAYMAQGRFAEAEAVLRRALALRPEYAMAYYNLGLALKGQKKIAEAELSLKRSLELKPEFAGGHYTFGCFLQEAGRIPEAIAAFTQAIRIDPNYTEAYRKLGECHAQQGQLDEAKACYAQVLDRLPDDIGTYAALAMIDVKSISDDTQAKLTAIECTGLQHSIPLTDHDMTQLNSTLGRLAEARKDFGTAFDHFIKANRIKRASLAYDPNRTTKQFADIKQLFDKSLIERLAGKVNIPDAPIFILGMPRSGTTLIEQILSSHPDVFGAGELPDLLDIATDGAAEPWLAFPAKLERIDTPALAAMGREYLARLHRLAPDAKRITDKMPGNFIAVGLIHLMLPNAKIIHVKRNPVDTCLSCFTTLFKGRLDFTYDLTELGRYYVDYTGLMAHWREILPAGAFLEVQYEDIVNNLEAESRRLLEHCGLAWDQNCLAFHQNERAVQTASITQVRQPIYRSSVERWRRYENQLKPLLAVLGDTSLPNR